MTLISNPLTAGAPATVGVHISSLLAAFKDYCLVRTDLSGIITDWNDNATHIFGYQPHEIVGHPLSAFIPSSNNGEEKITLQLQSVIRDGHGEREGWLRTGNGTDVYVVVTFIPIAGETNAPVGFALIGRDLTAQKKLEEENRILQDNLEEKVRLRTSELATVNQELEAFSYSVSHDLRAPLRAVSGFSTILLEDYAQHLDENGIRVVNTIIDNTRMMGQLIDDLLTFSRMSRLEAIYQFVDMSRLVDYALRELSSVAADPRHSITVHTLPLCKGDPNMLRQVWMNLLGNAIKYSSKQDAPAIEVGSEAHPDAPHELIYYIRDNGVGFDMKYAEKLFGVFQRLHRQDEFEGTGLGLALSKRIISKHGGRIWAQSTINNGAIFYFSLPKT